MNVNTNNLVSITEANQNFSRVARMVDESGAVAILKNNTPRYLLIEFGRAEAEQIASRRGRPRGIKTPYRQEPQGV